MGQTNKETSKETNKQKDVGVEMEVEVCARGMPYHRAGVLRIDAVCARLRGPSPGSLGRNTWRAQRRSHLAADLQRGWLSADPEKQRM